MSVVQTVPPPVTLNTVGSGFTITVAVNVAPVQLFAEGVNVKVTVTGAVVVLVKLPVMLPVPLAAMPIMLPVLSRVQLKVVPETGPEGVIWLIALPEQIVCVAGVAVPLGVGFTRTVAVNVAPVQLFAEGVNVKVTVTGAFVVFVKLPVTLPEPLEAMPVTLPVLSRVQLKVVPETGPEGMIVLIALPEQMVCVAGVAIPLGVGFTITVAVNVVPVQLFAEGVNVKVTVTGAFVVLVKLPVMSPVPLAAMPVTLPVLSRVQLNAVPETGPEGVIVLIALPEQMVCVARVTIPLGVGFTRTVAVNVVPVQLFAEGVNVKVTVIGAFVVLVKLPVMSPIPLAAIPVTLPVLSRVQLKVVPETGPEGVIVLMALPEQMVCVAGVAEPLGVGFTITVAIIGAPRQVVPAFV